MNFKIICLIICISLGYYIGNAQVKGIIKDAEGQTLPYATVYIGPAESGIKC
jgi:hypothetical protein